MSFLDAFQGYHQIPFALDDQEKTVFVIPTRNYHYKVMSFGLKNAGSTYQRMMTRMFEPQLGKSIEVYIDGMVVKSKVVSKHVTDLGGIFEILRKHRLRLNASKCSFGIGSGKFLGYIMTYRGIEVNPDQIKAINSRPSSDATVGHPRMSFLDAFQGYHQIPFALDDQEKTAFVTPTGNYHYKVMPFGLKNAGSTYQRIMTRMFKP